MIQEEFFLLLSFLSNFLSFLSNFSSFLSSKIFSFKHFNEKWTMFNINLGYRRGGCCAPPPRTEVPSQKPALVRVKGKLDDYHLTDKMTVVPVAPSTKVKIAMKTQTHVLRQAMMNSLAVLKLSTVNAFIPTQSTRPIQSLKRPKIFRILSSFIEK